AHRILLVRRAIDDVVVGDPAVVHREAIVVLRRDHDVLHAGVLRDADDLLRVELDWIELRRKRLVLGARDVRPRHDPLAHVLRSLSLPLAGGHGVEAPVDEHAEARVTPPLHPRIARVPGFLTPAERGGEEEKQADGQRPGEDGLRHGPYLTAAPDIRYAISD